MVTKVNFMPLKVNLLLLKGNLLLLKVNSHDSVESWSGLMGQLSEVARLCVASETWEGHFKMVLLLLLEGMQVGGERGREGGRRWFGGFIGESWFIYGLRVDFVCVAVVFEVVCGEFQ